MYIYIYTYINHYYHYHYYTTRRHELPSLACISRRRAPEARIVIVIVIYI